MDLLKAIQKSFPKIEKLFTQQQLIEFKNTKINDLTYYQSGLGTMIKIKILKPKSALKRLFIEKGITNTDIMTLILINLFHSYVR